MCYDSEFACGLLINTQLQLGRGSSEDRNRFNGFGFLVDGANLVKQLGVPRSPESPL